MQPNHNGSRNIKKSWEMIEKARLYLAKNAPQENRQQISRSLTTMGKSKPTGHIHPPKKKPRTDGEGVSTSHSNNEVSYPNGGFGQYANNNHAPGGSSYQPVRQTTIIKSAPIDVSSHAPQVGHGLQRRGASSTIAKRELARCEDGKAELQSLVKHSLSAMHKDKKKLGSNGYKEVARVSTHTILAAYGLEHHQALARSFSRPLCNHNKDMSNLVSGCCRDCFSSFVWRVVKSVLSENM
ncbi:hypothetical protein FCM35_KLT10300 [Carex littledalei]|uniref:Uncharacterized protein n=1 Tax=Carex littledalei TaxID=544730 RepID=A0A833VIN3_9POAL|nr:hypothetical protein FCM35_KLT10300 [Carex littledalei]